MKRDRWGKRNYSQPIDHSRCFSERRITVLINLQNMKFTKKKNLKSLRILKLKRIKSDKL